LISNAHGVTACAVNARATQKRARTIREEISLVLKIDT
jgi:hypothetical protein